MSREIKFRAWCGSSYMYPDTMQMTDGLCLSVSSRAWTNTQSKGIEQYTGFKDKNGVEIYEGDKFIDHFENDHGEVFYCNDKACFMVKVHESTHDEYETTSERIFPLFELDMSDLEVIGNKYENEGLIK